ncbi:MAG TPA: hypothetical protein EYH34_03560 [Planctomycetes bacterium]|nr:hypothetical protein [Planctomycetota bacterium]
MARNRPRCGNDQGKDSRRDLKAVTAMVASMWAAAEKADAPLSDWLRRKIVGEIERLKRQVDSKLRLAKLCDSDVTHARRGPPDPAETSDQRSPGERRTVRPSVERGAGAGALRTAGQSGLRPNRSAKRTSARPAAAEQQRTLFSEIEQAEAVEEGPSSSPPHEIPRFPDLGLRVYAKDFAPQALTVIPQAANFSDVEDYREHLAKTLPFNAVTTRRRAANFLIGRYFPGHHLHTDLTKFAQSAAGTPALPDVLFYLTCRTEKIVAQVAESLVWPSLAEGSVPRTKVKEFVAEMLPESKSAKQITSAIFRTYEEFGIGKTNRTTLSVCPRFGTLPAFAYILYLEFPEPGMYKFERVLQGPMQKWLLWDQAWIVEQLYSLRQARLLSKVSEIDSHRQFTTRFSLAEAMDRIVALAEKNPGFSEKAGVLN